MNLTDAIVDSTGRAIAPPQTILAERPSGAWDSNARPDGSWAGPVICAWCTTTMRAGNPAVGISHSMCAPCLERFEQETA